MRHTIKNVKAVHPLKNITRRATGWHVQKRVRNYNYNPYFSDISYGDSYKALNAAIRFRNEEFGDPMAEVRSETEVRLNTYGRPSIYLPKFEAGKPFMLKSVTQKAAAYRAARNYDYDITINGLKVTINR